MRWTNPKPRKVEPAVHAATVDTSTVERVPATPVKAVKKPAKAARGNVYRTPVDICYAILMKKGCGKSTKIKELIAGDPLVAIWDDRKEYGGFIYQSHELPQFVMALMRADSGTFVYQVPGDTKKRKAAFQVFCKAVEQKKNLTVVVEELKRVTTASWAPGAWGDLIAATRHLGVKLLATSQRPSQVDKDFLSQATHYFIGSLKYRSDAEALADLMPHTNANEIMALRQHYHIHYDELNDKTTHHKPDPRLKALAG